MVLAVFFFFKHQIRPSESTTDNRLYAKFALDSNSRKIETVSIKRPGYYRLSATSVWHGQGIDRYPLIIAFGNFFSITTDKYEIQEFPFYIPRPCELSFMFTSSYKSNLETEIIIKELSDRPKKYGVFLFPDKYANLTFKVKKGFRLDIPSQKELFYLCKFKDNQLADEILVPKKSRNFAVRFFDNYQIKFKSAEVPFLFIFESPPYIEHFSIITSSEQKTLPITYDTLYLLKGQQIKTIFWLDKGDYIYSDCHFTDNAMFSISNKYSPWKKISCGYRGAIYTASHNGFLKIKALNNCPIPFLKIERKTKLKFRLKKDKIKKIPVFQGDILESSCRQRYYVNNVLFPPNKDNQHYISGEDFLEFKSSLIQDNIYVKVIKRRGF